YENDLVNLLSSGKEWLGESFSSSATKTFSVDWPNRVLTNPVQVRAKFAGRSIGAPSSFNLQLNGQALNPVSLASISGYFLDATATEGSLQQSVTTNQTGLSLSMQFQSAAAGAEGWLNWFEMHGRSKLSMLPNIPLFFRDWETVNPGAVAQFLIAGANSNTQVWDITQPPQPQQLNTVLNGTDLNFLQEASSLHEFVAFDKNSLPSPILLGKINNQNLHQTGPADLLVITHNSLLAEAKRLAAFHLQEDGYKSVVVTSDQIYQEFASGNPDPTAIRDFVKMYFDKAGSASSRPRFLLLFGNGTYDYKYRAANNTNLVPTYQTVQSFDPLISHTSDDFFGLLDNNDDVNFVAPAGLLDIGIGRIPARNPAEATTMVNKIIHYHDTASFGGWRNQAVFIADDKDGNLHLSDAESLNVAVNSTNSRINQEKIYLDAFPLVSGNGGGRYPAVNEAIVNAVFNGKLIVNYSGHGNYLRLSEEAVISATEVKRFNNPDKLPLFITASCDFAPYDDPSKQSLGSSLLMDNANGAIALMTTTRVVFAYSNRIMNDNYLRIALKPSPSGQYLTLGEAVMAAKNETYQSFGDVFNNRKFTLLGDPAMRLAFPKNQVQLTAINGQTVTGKDSLQALGKYQVSGKITDGSGNTLTNFQGVVETVLYDKAQSVKTLGNDAASPVTSFQVQNSILYKGRATVKNGIFQFSMILPKDINYQPGKGRFSFYATDGKRDAGGADTNYIIAGLAPALTDNQGPVIKAWLNDTAFKKGGLTHENPVLLLDLADSSGINVSGAGIGHDITTVIDGNERNVLVLNGYYTGLLDDYQRGTVRYQLPTMSPGKHQIRIKAWDLANNSSQTLLDFEVANQEKSVIQKLMNYPNPFTDKTTISFEHNQPNTQLPVEIAIYSSSGQLVKTIRKTVFTAGTRNCEIQWDGTNENGQKLKKAIYIYRVVITLGEHKYVSAGQMILY
ncbi:MAG TPA: type IX secretion system sortase PorU, partial [Sediminibacterium sp.]|nr:type IX secretion system sortase PorU [Sediminibacterium sp.]